MNIAIKIIPNQKEIRFIPAEKQDELTTFKNNITKLEDSLNRLKFLNSELRNLSKKLSTRN